MQQHRLAESSVVVGGRRPVFVALGGAYAHRPPAEVAAPLPLTTRGRGGRRGCLLYLVPVARRPVCVTRVRAA